MSWIITGKEAGSLGLLDQYGGAAAAYSLRNLSLYYTDPVVRVRRSNDNAEQDFTATEVSDGTLAAWVGAGNNGFVRTWYDQSGNGRHAAQGTTANQPQIVSSGTVVTYGTKPATSYSGSSFMVTTGFASLPAFTSVYSAIVCQQRSDPKTLLGRRIASGTDPAGTNFQFFSNGNTWNGSLYDGPLLPDGNQVILSWSWDASGTRLSRKNGQTLDTAISYSFGTLGNEELAIGRRGVTQAGEYYSGFVSEILLYSSDQVTVMSAIEANINAHYSIYP